MNIYLKIFHIPCILFASLLLVNISFAESIEDALDKEMLDSNSSLGGQTGEQMNEESKWQIFGFFESENYFGISGKGKQGAREIAKLEARANANLKYGSDFFYGKAVLDAYFYPDFEPSTSNAGHAQPHKSGVIEARELYLAAGETLQIKLGKQLYGWGEADTFTVTNYPDQNDLRELLATDNDERYQGVMSVSLKYIYSDFSIEAAVIPLHTPALYPDQNGFWRLQGSEVPINVPAIPLTPLAGGYSQNVSPELGYGQSLSGSYRNASSAIRIGGTIQSLDFHVSYFNGIDKSILFLPVTTIENAKFASNEAYSITANPYYKHVQSAGLDFAFDIEKLTIRGEASFSPQKWAIIKNQEKQAEQALNRSLTNLGGGNNAPVSFSAETEQTMHLAYVIGADYLVWGENGRLLIEWMQASYVEHPHRYQEDFFTDILLIRVEDKLFNNRLELSLTAMIRPVQEKAGFIAAPEIGWNFQNGFTLTSGAMFFTAHGDQLLNQFDDNDFAYLAGKMNF